MTSYIKVLFIGDIVGRPGRKILKDYLGDFALSYDFIITNVENASHGFGLTEKNYKELSDLGIHCFTSGNHIWDKKDIYSYINNSEKLIRPWNYPKGTYGVGYRIFDVNRCYALHSENKDTLIMQFFTLDNLLKPASYYFLTE